MDAIATTQVRWQPCYRIVASRFPPISLFEDVADPADLEAVYAIEAMTNTGFATRSGTSSSSHRRTAYRDPEHRRSWQRSPT